MSKTPVSTKFTVALIALCALAACGGGGGGTPAATTPAATTPVAPYTQSDAQAVAGLGFLVSELITTQAQFEQPFMAGFAQGFFSTNGVQGSTGLNSASCVVNAVGSGTFSLTVTKSGTYAGLKANDKIDITFNNCKIGAGNVQNGRLIATAQADYPTLGASGSGFKFNYQLNSINYQQASSTARFVSNGIQNVQFDSTVNANFPKLSSSIVSAYTYKSFNPASATTASIEFNINPGAILSSQLTSAGANYTNSIDGAVGLTVASDTIALAFATPTPLTGAVNAAGRLIPAAGVLRVKETTANLQTESTVQGAMVQVKADTNRDGTLDLTFSTTYSLLTN